MLDWSLYNKGHKLLIDPYDQNFPIATIISLDLETNGKEITDPNFKIVCIGLSEDGNTAKVFFDLRPELFEYLRKTQFICHNGLRAEILWLKSYGITKNNLYFDTKIGMYVYDSTRKNYSLKPTLEALFNIKYPTYEEMITNRDIIDISCQESLLNDSPPLYIIDKKGNSKLPKTLTLDKMPKEIVADYNGLDCIYTFKLWTWLRQNYTISQLNFLNTIEFPMLQLIYNMEQQGVKIDTKAIRRIHNEHSIARRKAKKQVFELSGQEFNLNSPKQVLPILQTNGIPVRSTGEEAIQSFKSVPLVKSLLDYRSTQKICSTYTIPLYTEAIKNPDNRIHARFNQNTITGRLSSSDPINLQNQPPIIREAFIAKEGYKLIGSDWTNVELYLPANFSKEPGFIEELSKPNGDLHIRTANFLFNQDIKSLSQKEYDEKRQKAKTCNFLLTNSGSAKRLASELQCSEKEAEGLYKRFWDSYPILAAWLKNEKRLARERGGVTTLYGRWVPFAQLNLWCGRSNCPIFGPNGYFCKSCFIREATEREAISVLVQGSASDLMKLAALRLYKEDNLVPIISCHDELLYEIEGSQVEKYKEKIKYVMENIYSFTVPLKANIKVGNSWKEAH